MAYEMLVGLEVIDDVIYQRYRDAMAPILKAHDGRFGYDFKVSDVLKSETSKFINRVFTINFPNAAQSEAFFTNPEYIVAKEKYFESSVNSTTIISSYEVID